MKPDEGTSTRIAYDHVCSSALAKLVEDKVERKAPHPLLYKAIEGYDGCILCMDEEWDGISFYVSNFVVCEACALGALQIGQGS